MPERIVGEAVIVVGADASAFQAQTKIAAEKAGTGAGAGFSKSFDKEAQKGAKSTGAGFSARLSSALTKGFSKIGLVDGLTGKFRSLDDQSDSTAAHLEKVKKKLAEVNEKGLSPLILAATGLGPALIPVLGVATVAVGTLGAALGGAAAGAGVFGAVFKSSYADVKKQVQQSDKLNANVIKYQSQLDDLKKGTDKYKTALKNVNLNQSMLKSLLEGMSKPEAAAYEGFDKMKTSWAKFKDQNQGQTLTIMARGFNLIAKIIPMLQPLFDSGADAVATFLLRAERWTAGGGLKDLILFLRDQADHTLPLLETIFVSLGVTIGRFFRAAAGGPSLLDWFAKLATAAAGWSAGGGFERFAEAMGNITPTVVATLASLGTSLGHIAQAIFPLAPLSLALAQALGILTASIPIPVLTALLGLYIGLNVATKAHAVYLAADVVATQLWSAAIKVASIATKAWAIAQEGLNLVLSLNPIALVIIGLVALGAALVLAYQKSQTFRDIVNGAWAAIRAAVGAVAGWITGTVLPAVTAAWSAISSAAVTAFNFIVGVGKTVVSFLASTFGPQFWFLEKTVEATVKAIIILVLGLWQTAIQPVFNQIIALIKVVASTFLWLWHNAVTPAVNGIVAAVKYVWSNGVQPTFSQIRAAITALGNAYLWLWNNAVKPAFNGIVATIKYVWNNGIAPQFAAIKSGVGKVRDAFNSSVGGIKTAWNKLEGIAKAPIKFMIGTVLNGGLIKAFNWLGSKVGGPHIDNIPLPFATGGVLPGYTPGRDVHEFVSATGGRLRLSGGEAVMRPEFTRMVGGKAGVDALNARARSGMGLGDFASGGVIPGFAGGGVLNFIKKAGSGAFNWVGDKASSISKAFANPLDYLQSKMRSVGGPGVIPDFANAASKKLLTASVSKIKSLFSIFSKAFGGGPAIKGPRVHVDGQVLDADTYARLTRAELASGIAMRVIQGSFSNRVGASMGTHAGAGAMDLGPAGGRYAGGVSALRAQGLLAMFRNWPGNKHIHSINPAVYSAMAPATQRQVKRAQANNGIFANGGVTSFDSGGLLPKGLSLAYNGTGRPEPVGHDLGGDTTINVTIEIEDLAKLHTLEDFLKMLENSRANSRKTRRSGVTSA